MFQLSFLFQHKFQRKATHFVPALSMVAAYAVTGWLGLWLAIPPGYATAIWPASGLALAGVLMGDARVWPGIWLGSFVANLGTAFDATDAAALLMSVAIPTSIGMGATLQALVGASLVRRYVGFPSALTRGREIGTFLMLGGPVSCLVSATVVKHPTGMHWKTTVELAGRRWGLRFAPTLKYLAARQSLQPWAVLGGSSRARGSGA